MSDTKRSFLEKAALTGLASMLGAASARADELPYTPLMDLGPFYPVQKPKEVDADLTRLTGHKVRAKGEIMEVSGRVLDRHGKPVSGAKLEIWQANAGGRYAHPGDSHGELDPNFQGYARLTADAEGRYSFLTIKPGAYPAGDYMRAAHIHFDVTGRDDRLVTQMYFPGDPLLGQDAIFKADLSIAEEATRAAVFGKLTSGASTVEKGATLCRWDVVLYDG